MAEGEGGVKHIDFYKDLMVFLAEPHIFSRALFSDVYDIKVWIVKNRSTDEAYRLLCHCSVRAAKHLKRRLPDDLHNRLVLGEQNHYTRQYAKLVSNWEGKGVSA